ncbi:heavy metal translocating P-type ATPase [Brachybacterium sp. DNPG3]
MSAPAGPPVGSPVTAAQPAVAPDAAPGAAPDSAPDSTPSSAPDQADTADGGSLWRRIDRADLARTLGVALVAVLVAVLPAWPSEALPLLALAGLVVGLWPILGEALEDVRHRRMSMELSMLLAIAAAAAIGEWVTALVITAFVLAAEILEDLSMDRGRDALTDLMSFLPDTVRVRADDAGARFVEVPLAEVSPGQIVLIAPGGRVPVDGTVVTGASSLDASRITGESLPVDVGPGDAVHAGSVNSLGAIEVRAERVGAESAYGRIVEAVREAQESEAPVQRLADRLATWLVVIALAGAAITFLLTRDVTATISVVIVAGACGVAAGTPLAVLAAIARAARTGALIKGGAHLEALSAIDTVVLDKTGTLTRGELETVEIAPADGSDATELLALAAAAELYSEHPVGQAIVRRARADALALGAPEDFVYAPGRGVEARIDGRLVRVGTAAHIGATTADGPTATAGPSDTDGGTTVHVSVDGRRLGAITLADTARDGASDAVAALRADGLRVVMLTGDTEGPARAMASELGISEVRAGLLPAQKLEAIDAERAAGHRVAMVGDGVNDAPALGRADVGIAMGSGTVIAQESADVVLISSDPEDLVRTLRIARRARRIVMVNFVGTIVVDLVGIGLAGAGLLSPIAAALVHVGSETAFILNSARLIPGRRTGRR